ncbi:MAG: TonB-dependent receptor [Caulobacteraceae bacterium]|nr:TonB-dependent receptor [Caulobacteraceae bacterium]
MQRSLKARLWAASGAAALLFAAAPAFAQDTTEVDEVIVTVQLREQSAQDVPAAVSALSGDFMEDLGLQDFAEVSQFVPGFEVQNQSANNPGFVIRGITSDSLESFNEPRISVFQDGVSVSKAAGSFVELFDVDRVEIAKGPQSTLFGRGALIGAVNIIQSRPDLGGFDASARAEMGSDEYAMFEGMLNVPLSDTVGFRFATRLKERDGYVDNLLHGENYNSQDTMAFRGTLSFVPNDHFRYDIIANYQEDNTAGTAFKSINFLQTDPNTGAVLADTSIGSGAALNAPSNFPYGPMGLHREVWGISGIGAWEISDSLKLTSITAYREFDAQEVGDADGISLPVITFLNDAQGDQFSQELRLNWDNGGRVSWFAGVNYFSEDGSDSTPAMFDERIALAQLTGNLSMTPLTGNPSNQPAALPFYGVAGFNTLLIQGLVTNLTGGAYNLSGVQALGIANNLKSNHLETATNGQDLTSWDVFGDVTFRPTDQWEFSAGLRYTTDDKTVSFSSHVDNGRSILGGLLGTLQAYGNGQITAGQLFAILGNPFTPGTPGALGTPGAVLFPPALLPLFGLTFQPTANNGDTIRADLSDDGFTWRLTALYRATDDVNLYANYARGRRPEVLSAAAPASPQGAPRFTRVEAETVDSYEVGAKAELMGRALRLDGAIYYYTYDNFQTIEQQGTLFVTTNAGEATAYGFEGQFFWRPSANIDVFGNYAYNHARFDSGAYEGNRFRLSPDHSLSFGADFRFPTGGGVFDVRPTWTWQSKVFFENNNDDPALQTIAAGAIVADTIRDEYQDSYGLLNLRAGYEPDDGHWRFEVFADNLLDEEYIIDAGNTGDGLGLPTYIPGEPRTWGFSFTIRH